MFVVWGLLQHGIITNYLFSYIHEISNSKSETQTNDYWNKKYFPRGEKCIFSTNKKKKEKENKEKK
jgi:hypothetical protein